MLPFCYVTLKAQKPGNPAYPEGLKTLGDHIRKRRLDLGVHQKDGAALVNASTSTVPDWEKNRVDPTLRYRPKIISFLGYNPLPGTPPNFGQEIKFYRRNHGLSIKQIVKVLSVDPATLAKWERGKTVPGANMKNRLKGLFSNSQYQN